MSDAMWHYAVDGAKSGPVSHADMCAMFAQSQLPIETQVWSAGMAEWVAASVIPEFRGIWGKGFAGGGSAAAAPPASVARPTLAPIVADTFDNGTRLSPSGGDMAGGVGRAGDKRWDATPQVRPWIRFWARGLDESLIVAAAVYLFATAWPEGLFYFPYVIVGSMVLHPIQMTMFGTTLGKFVFGISVETEHGEPPSLGQAAAREFAVLLRGCGLNILFLPLITKITAYKKLLAEGATSWDRDQNLVVRHRPVGPLRWGAWVTASLALGLYIFAAAGDFKANGLAKADSFSGVRKVRAAVLPSDEPAAQPTAQPTTKPRPKPKLLSLPSDPAPSMPTIKPKNPGKPSTRPARPANRPPPRVVFKPEATKEP